MTDLRDTAKLCKILQNVKGSLVYTIKLGDIWAEGAEEALGELLQMHFSGFKTSTKEKTTYRKPRGFD